MKANRLVAVFGGSDDLIEMRGAVNDEVGAYNGGEACFNVQGLLQNDCENDNCPHFAKAKVLAPTVHALWCEEDGFSWTYLTDIPHETFLIMEDDETYCRGIVFSLDRLTA